MRIGIDIRHLTIGRGGVVVYSKNLIRNLTCLDNKNEYFLFNYNHSQIIWDNPNNNTNEIIIRLPQRFRLTKWLWEKYLAYYFRKYKIDIVFSPAYFISPSICRPKIITIHELLWANYPTFKNTKKAKYIGKCMQKIINDTNLKKIITPSAFLKTEVLARFKKINEKDVCIIHEGIDEKFHKIHDAFQIEQVKKRNKIRGEYILYVGELCTWKNIENILKSFCNLIKKDKNLDLNLVLVGKKSFEFEQLLVRTVPNKIRAKIITPGYIINEELPFLYNGAKVFIFLSHYEGFGLASLEAMACGTPILASNKTAIPEVLSDAAIYADPNNVNEITEKLKDIIYKKIDVEIYIKKGLNHIKKFTWEKTAKETLEIFNSVF